MKTQTIHFHPKAHPKSETFKANASDALADAPLRKSLRTAMDGLMAKRKSVLSDEHELQTLRDLCEHIRQRSLAQLPELLTQLETNLTRLGVQVHWAETTEQACAIIHQIMLDKNSTLMVKGKSMVSEEIELNHYLAERDIEAIESDMGEYIVQMAGENRRTSSCPRFTKPRSRSARCFTNTCTPPRRPMWTS